jgi:hypothetical protein
MHKLVHVLLPIALAAIASSFVACGDSDDPSPVVAKVRHMSITRETLSHWMTTLVDGDFREHVGGTAPRGLVSDPPSYRACVSAIEALGRPKASGTDSKPGAMQREAQCRQLHQALKQQALSYLIEGLWNIEEAADQGIHITDAEIDQQLAKDKASLGPVTHQDQLYLVKRSLLSTRLNEQRERALRGKMPEGEALQRAVAELYAQSIKRWPAQTSCRAGYLVAQCRGYKAPTGSLPSPAVLVEQIAASR